MEESIAGISNLMDNVLAVNKSDRVLIASDLERIELTNNISNCLKKREIRYSVINIDYDGKNMPGDLSGKLLDNEHNVILLFFGKSIWHQKERRRAKYELGKRIVAYSGTLEMLKDGPALADPRKLKQLCDDLRAFIGNGTHISIEGTDGTYIQGECLSLGFENCLYTNPGQGGNFPSGEIYSFGLKEESIEGFIDSNIKVKHLGLSTLGNNAIFGVKNGKIIPIANLPALNFFNLIKDNPELFYVGELGFGINPYKKIFEYKDSIQEEKILGTAHVGLGSNISFGGNRTGKHLDIVFGPVTVKIDDKKIIINEKMNSEYLSQESREWIKEKGLLYES